MLSLLGDSEQLHCHDGRVAIFKRFSDEGRFSSLIFQAVFCFSSKEKINMFSSQEMRIEADPSDFRTS